MNDLGSSWLVSFLLGAAFVVLYATARLRGPEADRSFTTLHRYTVSTLYFALGHLAIYLLAVCALWAAGRFDKSGISAFLLLTPGWLALLTAGVLPRVKPFSILDTVFRAHARNLGGMPDEALRLRDAIVAANIRLPERDFQEMHYGLLRRGVDVGNQRRLPDDTLHAQFLQIAQLKFQFDKCMRQRRHFTFARDNARGIQMLTRRYDHLMFRASRGIEAIGQLHQLANSVSGKSGNWESLGALADNEAFATEPSTVGFSPAASTSRMLIANLREDTRYFANDISLMFARMTLRKRWTERGRVKLLEKACLQVAPVPRPHFRALTAVFSVVALTMWVVGAFNASSMGQREALNAALMIPLMFVIAVLCAVYPKQFFAFANVSIYGRPPYLFYFVAGIAAASLAFIVGLVFRLVRLENGHAALVDAYHKSPWLLMTFTLASVLAMLVQDTRGFQDERHQRMRSLRDALVLGTSLAIAMVAVQFLLQFTDPRFRVPRYGLLVFGFGLGAFIGFYIPKRFRNVFRARQDPEQEFHAGRMRTFTTAWRFMKGAAP